MATTPAADNLDERLNQALIGLYARNPEGEFVPVNDKYDVLKDEIKEIFNTSSQDRVMAFLDGHQMRHSLDYSPMLKADFSSFLRSLIAEMEGEED